MNTKKLLALIVALVMALTMSATALADWTDADYAAAAIVMPTDYTGKTIILHTNDVHGAIDGYAYIPTLRNWFEAQGASDVIVADAGDFSQGTIYVSTNKGAVAVEMMNAAGYDVVTLGNHEFDFGYEQLIENLKNAAFLPISANVIFDDGEPILPPTAIFETEAGLKVAFVGLETPETSTKVNPGLIMEIHFTFFDDLYAYAQAAVDAVRDEADVVIGLWHLGVDDESKANGYRSIDVLDKITGVDFVLDGHSHTVMTAGENGEPIQSTGTKFANIGVVVIDNATKTIENNFLVSTKGLVKNGPVAAKAQAIMDEIDAQYGAVFATTEVLLNGDRDPGNRTEETNLGDLITDAMVWSVVKEGGLAQPESQVVGLTNGGGIRAPIAVGDISMKDINTVLPFGNTVSVVYVTGAELLEALEASTFCTPKAIGGYPQTSGIRWTLDTTKEFDQGDLYVKLNGDPSTYYAPASIQRVTIESVNGEPFDPEAVYAVVTNNFITDGGDTYVPFGYAFRDGGGFDTGIPMDEAVMAYVTDVLNGTITAEAYGAPQGRETQIR